MSQHRWGDHQPKIRGSRFKPPNRFERLHIEEDLEQVDGQGERRVTEYYTDDSRSIISENNSPDVGFRYSLNPYRGCLHGCSYCYARPTHEYYGLNAGLDFESRVFVKPRAPELFRQWLSRDAWQAEAEPIAFSGVTDCYQPIERQLRLTGRCLQVACQARQPIRIITKNALVTRDVDVLGAMAQGNLVSVSLSITTLDAALAGSLEPRTSTPAARLRALERLSQVGIPTQVMVAPIIPGLNDSEIPAILHAASRAGATSASYILLRLPISVRPVFLDWLQRAQPAAKDRVESRIRATREGKLNDARFGSRMRGVGEIAAQIRQTFQLFAGKHGLSRDMPPLDQSQLRPLPSGCGQLRLFDT